MKRRGSVRFSTVLILAAAAAALSLAAGAQTAPPGRINYQGVLRDASGAPINANVSMTFRLYDAPSSGTLLWEETYNTSPFPPQVTVSNGLFSVALGDATHRTGGSEAIFSNVFSKHADIYLAVQVETDPEMAPRIQVRSAPFAQNAHTIDGADPGDSGNILMADGVSWTSVPPPTASAMGAVVDAANFSLLRSGSGTQGDPYELALNPGNSNIWTAGQQFQNNTLFPGGGIWNTSGRVGIGTAAPSYMLHVTGIGYFEEGGTSHALIAGGGFGIRAYGTGTGGFFKDSNSTGQANVGYGDRGIQATGSEMGGYFGDSNGTGYAYVANDEYGIKAWGDTAGGYFRDRDHSGFAYAGYGNYGVSGYGNYAGGDFHDLDNGGRTLAGFGAMGLKATGTGQGGRFEDTDDSGIADVAFGDYGIKAYGDTAGGYFKSSNGGGYANVGFSSDGISAHGNGEGGYFDDLNDSGWAAVGYYTYKIFGTGAVSFVQNHPYRKDRVIVYAAPEGDEVAVYTRGTARLVNGEARIELGETFQWVANPDIGLTAYATPKSDCNGLYVASVSTTELVVKELGGGKSNTAFNYIVYGLRIGFEESSIVQEKQQEAFIPSFKNHRERYTKYPELRAYDALERFKGMQAAMKGVSPASFNFSRAQALKNAVHEYDPSTDPPVGELFGFDHSKNPALSGGVSAAVGTVRSASPQAAASSVASPAPVDISPSSGSRVTLNPPAAIPIDSEGNVYGRSFRPSRSELALSMETVGPVEAGDVLAADRNVPGRLRLAAMEADPAVVGIVAGTPGVLLGSTEKSPGDKKQDGDQSGTVRAPVVLTGIAVCKVDAGYGAIAVGDLLVTSPTPGRAMRALDPRQGTVIGKALEPLDTGTGLIKVLVMLR